MLNVESRGFQVSVYYGTEAVTQAFVAQQAGKRLVAAATMQDFEQSLATPRRIMPMVQAGAAVDAVIEQLIPLLDKDDIVIDGGNSCFALQQQAPNTGLQRLVD